MLHNGIFGIKLHGENYPAIVVLIMPAFRSGASGEYIACATSERNWESDQDLATLAGECARTSTAE